MKAIEYIKEIHRNTDGYITFFRKLKDGKPKQYHYKISEINEDILNEWVTHDSYISLNSFFVPRRRIQTIRTLHNLYVDIDCYNVNMSPEQVLYELENDYYGAIIPKPNLVTHSGRGIQLVWNIEAMSGKAIERWDLLQKELYKALKHFGADNKALDASRIFRLVGSINSKNESVVYSDKLHDYEYNYAEIVEEYFPHVKTFKRQYKTSNKKSKTRIVYFGFNSYTLAQSRLKDLETIVKIRHGEVEGHRERILFLVRLNTLRITNSDNVAVAKMKEINGLFVEPLNESELIKATASAVTYHEQGGLNMRNGTYIEWLDITLEEQEKMSTLISRAEKKARDRRRKQKQAKQSGRQTMEQYNAKRRRRVLRYIKRLKLIKAIYPLHSIRELAERIGLSKTYVCDLLKMMNCEQCEQVSSDLSALVKRECTSCLNILSQDSYVSVYMLTRLYYELNGSAYNDKLKE